MLTTIAGTYENGQVLFQETIPNYEKCDVFVTFLPKIKQMNTKPNKLLFGKGPLYDATKTTLKDKLEALDYLSGL